MLEDIRQLKLFGALEPKAQRAPNSEYHRISVIELHHQSPYREANSSAVRFSAPALEAKEPDPPQP